MSTTRTFTYDTIVGPAGSTGPPGLPTFLLDEALDGDPGPPGQPGTQGVAGAAGTTGAQGPTGPAIFLLDEAFDGEQGTPGQTGAQGAAGTPGTTGSQGPTGPAIFLLDEAFDGDAGPPGSQGNQGPAGATGAQGPMGPVAAFLYGDPGSDIEMSMLGDGLAEINPRVVVTPAVPASTTAIKNATGRNVTVYVKAGTLTVITVGGVATGIAAAAAANTAHSIPLSVNQTIAITYTVAPTWVWIGT